MNSTSRHARFASAHKTRNAALGLAVPVLAATAVIGPAALGSQSAAASNGSRQVSSRITHFSGGGVTIAGNKWLQGHGVAVIRSRQCTELASRLYAKRHWGQITDFYGMRTSRTYSKKLSFHRNGSTYVPVPGDVLVELGGSYQHVAVVNKVTKRHIYTVEQNAAPSGRHVYNRHGHHATGAYGPRHVGGFIHSSKNHHRNGPRH